MRLGPEVEYLCHTQVEILCIHAGVLEPTGAVQVNVLDDERVERVDVTHQDLEMLQGQKSKRGKKTIECLYTWVAGTTNMNQSARIKWIEGMVEIWRT